MTASSYRKITHAQAVYIIRVMLSKDKQWGTVPMLAEEYGIAKNTCYKMAQGLSRKSAYHEALRDIANGVELVIPREVEVVKPIVPDYS